MITRVEIDGFKTFENFAVDLRPFMAVFGPNASGKSNFFDAIKLLSDLADMNLNDAFNANRGDAEELFRFDKEGNPKPIKLAVEMLVEPTIKDEFGNEVSLNSKRLRYELILAAIKVNNSIKEIQIKNEHFSTIITYEMKGYTLEEKGDDYWYREFIEPYPHYNIIYNTTTPRIDNIKRISENNEDIIKMNAMIDTEGEDYVARMRFAHHSTFTMTRTALSGVEDASEFPHIYAAKKEMLSWKNIQLNSNSMREPVKDKKLIKTTETLKSDGSNLAAVLDALDKEDPGFITDISNEFASIVKELNGIKTIYDEFGKRFAFTAEGADGKPYSSRVLSDGTLRLLALITLKHDPNLQGTLLVEEPENGVDPRRIERIADILRDTATDFTSEDEYREDAYLKQVIVNSHSPVLLAKLKDEEIYLSLSGRSFREEGMSTSTQFHPLVPIVDDTRDAKYDEEAFTRDQVKRILHTVTDEG